MDSRPKQSAAALSVNVVHLRAFLSGGRLGPRTCVVHQELEAAQIRGRSWDKCTLTI